MSTKTYFKRISLAVIFALSFGALSSAPSQGLVSSTASLTLSAASASKVATETSTVTITASFTSNVADETFTVTVEGTGAATQGNTVLLTTLTDSANVKSGSTRKWFEANAGDSITANAADTFTRAKVTLAIRNVANVGTHIYTINLRDRSMAIVASTTYTLTVAAANTDASAATSQLFLNEALPTHNTYYMSDSTLVKSAGQLPTLNLMTPGRVAYLGVNFRNSAGESTVSTSGTAVGGTMVVKITSGPGLLSDSTNVLVRQVSVKLGDTVTVWNDGSSGVTTIVGYIGNAPLAQAAKTMTFYGKATKFVATANAVTARGWNLDYSDTGVAGSDILSFIATDTTGLAVPSPSQNIAQKFYVNTSDTTLFARLHLQPAILLNVRSQQQRLKRLLVSTTAICMSLIQ